MKFKIPPQINRLVILFILVTGLFLIIRQFLVPDTFGELGHYRAESLQDNADIPMNFSGARACLDCHEDIYALKDQDLHKKITCETCHGPGLDHINSMESKDIVVPEGRQFCGRCHAQNAARSSSIVKQVDLASHNAELDCNECHNAHQPWEMLK